jgi:NAD(P)-dependent dehydrogenase (short-subunit alcohol dehydrogenase family)
MSVYILTGASRGIGFEMTRQLVGRSEITVLAIVRKVSDALHALNEQRPNLHVIICDLSSPDLGLLLDTWIRQKFPSGVNITHIVNNAAVVAGPEYRAISLSASALNECINTNVLAPPKVIEAALPHLVQTGGVIINISSGIGSLQLVSDGTISAHVTAYSISKCALNMLTVHVAKELRGKTRVICLDPGHVRTQMGGDAVTMEAHESAASVIQVRRCGTGQGKIFQLSWRGVALVVRWNIDRKPGYTIDIRAEKTAVRP